MRKEIAELLICPACLPKEKPLTLQVSKAVGDEVFDGRLVCHACHHRYTIRDGIPILLPWQQLSQASDQQYSDDRTVSSYLWSHYADLFGDKHAHVAYRRFAEMLQDGPGIALDLGCAVGRLTFELAARGGHAFGIDRSFALLSQARHLARDGHLAFDMTVEGELTEPRRVELPPELRRRPCEFMVADAMSLPFPASAVRKAASVNLLDKLPSPRRHLDELNRVMAESFAEVVLADPFSWSEEVAPRTAWLSGTEETGVGREVLPRIFRDEMTPAWEVVQTGAIPWTIRTHRNHYELIQSDFFVASR
ncbi:MAG: SAM-dependent methyltransferase [Desulfuromonas sp.]|mgnify:CR=1 FL=1|nr:MAG: SAM-dependent methyltransferase [Desulfuromonas sp.]